MSVKRTEYSETPDTLKQAILSMQRKIQEHEAEFLAAPLTVEVEMGDGRWIVRANPELQEYRALVRDFAAALKAYKDLTGDEQPTEISSLEDIRSRFKVAK